MKEKIIKFLLFLLSASTLTYCFFWLSEEMMVQNATRLMENSAFRNGAQELIQFYHQSLCDQKRLQICTIEFFENKETITFSIPSIPVKSSIKWKIAKHNNIKLKNFSGNVFVSITLLPTIIHFFYLFFLAIIFHIPFILFYLYILQKNKLSESVKLNTISKQMAHDVRSPLAALNISLDSESLSKEERNLFIKMAISRINEISASLINTEPSSTNNLKLEYKNLNSLINLILIEKKMQFGNEVSFEIKSAEIFLKTDVLVNEIEFLRVISNLINNAIEARSTKIILDINTKGEYLQLIIRDNGIGINFKTLKKIQSNEIVSNKVYGNALGLSHAIKVINKFGGKFSINSDGENLGTLITITLNYQFTDQNLVSNILLDNDPLVHLAWKAYAKKNNKQLICLYNKQELEHFLRNKSKNINVYLDYDLSSEINGYQIALDLKEKGFHNIHLVTGLEQVSDEIKKVFKTASDKMPKF